MAFVIMTVGKTHSGKTTFGKKIASKVKNSCLLDSDEIAIFLKSKFYDLYTSDFIYGSNKLSDGYYLKLKVLLDIYTHALKTNFPIISTSANSKKELRKMVVDSAREAGREVILVFFNWPEEVLRNRIEKSNRSKKCLVVSEDFGEVLNKQNKSFETPRKEETDYYFEINSEESYKKVLKEIIKKYS